VGSQILNPRFGGDFTAGLQGKIINIPAGWAHGTLMYGGQGVDATFHEWGRLLLHRSGKQPTRLNADLIIQVLSQRHLLKKRDGLKKLMLCSIWVTGLTMGHTIITTPSLARTISRPSLTFITTPPILDYLYNIINSVHIPV